MLLSFGMKILPPTKTHVLPTLYLTASSYLKKNVPFKIIKLQDLK